ncbi:MAG TPA: hypothetical protein VEB21_16645 [Terriglobales bacterium]|nr:hypothetical protein [Terriglobales bacterium]
MAKASSKALGGQTTEILSRLQGNIKTLQTDAERLLRRTQKQATQLISRDQRRAVERMFKQAQRLRTDLEKRAQRASKDVESRANRLLSTIEKEASKRFQPLVARLDFPTRAEFRTLSRRIAQLERKVAPQKASSKEDDDA